MHWTFLWSHYQQDILHITNKVMLKNAAERYHIHMVCETRSQTPCTPTPLAPAPHLTSWPWWLLTKSHCRHDSPHFRRQLPVVTNLCTRTCLTLICIASTHLRDFRLLECLTTGDGPNRLYRNVGILPFYAVQIPWRARISHTQHPFTDKLIYKRTKQTHREFKIQIRSLPYNNTQ